jgi:hypothetical protein
MSGQDRCDVDDILRLDSEISQCHLIFVAYTVSVSKEPFTGDVRYEMFFLRN